MTRIRIVRGYYGAGSRVHQYSYNYRRKQWVTACDPTAPGYADGAVPETQRPLDCYRCQKALGLIKKYPGLRGRRDAIEAEHLIRSTVKIKTRKI